MGVDHLNFKWIRMVSIMRYIILLLLLSNVCFAGYTPNAVSSNTSHIAVDGAEITSTTSCGINRQIGSWLGSTSKTSTGLCTLTFTKAYTSAPICTCSGSGGNRLCVTFTIGTTSVDIRMRQAETNTAVDDSNINVTCVGPR
jgi:hypothetical protein